MPDGIIDEPSGIQAYRYVECSYAFGDFVNFREHCKLREHSKLWEHCRLREHCLKTDKQKSEKSFSFYFLK